MHYLCGKKLPGIDAKRLGIRLLRHGIIRRQVGRGSIQELSLLKARSHLNQLSALGGTATMAYKSLNLRHQPCRTWLPEPSQRPLLLDPNVEMGPFPRSTKETGGLPVLDDHLLYPPALREILESDNYQVALVPRGEWDHIRGSQVAPFSTSAPPVLLPFSWKELVARLCEFVRDSNTWADCRVAQFEDVCVDFATMEVSRLSGEPIGLTTQEFKTLKCFLLNPDRVFSRQELLTEAWGYENYPATRTVDNHVLKLRQKLERDPARPVHFRTVHSIGYKFVP